MGRAAVTSLWLALPCVLVLGFTSAELTEIVAKSGDTAKLPCQMASNIKVVEWSRPDLNPECVLLYRNKQFDPLSQNPSFKNRVDLQMKDGNLTLILKNVTKNDAGKYECRVLSNRKKRAVEPVSSVYLRVAPPGQTGGHSEAGSVGMTVGLSVTAVLLVAAAVVVVLLIYRKKIKSVVSYQPPPELQSV